MPSARQLASPMLALVIAAAMSLAACAHKPLLTPEGVGVETTTVAPGPECRPLIDTSGTGESDNTASAIQRARFDLRNRAGRMGGNLVLLESQTARELDFRQIEIVITGKVYACR